MTTGLRPALAALLRRAALACALLGAAAAHALTPAQALAMAQGDSDARIAAIEAAIAAPTAPLGPYLRAMADDAVVVADGRALVVRDGQASDPVTGTAVALPEGAEDVMNNNRLRGEISAALAALDLFAPDTVRRREAAQAMLKQPSPERLPLLERALAQEKDAQARQSLELARSAAQLGSSDLLQRRDAAAALGDSGSPQARLLLQTRLAEESDERVQAQLRRSLAQVDDRLAWGERLGVVFTGISLGSILLLVALGLAITYGLMGVINMAHGELMMIGAYATYLVQGVFRSYLPEFFDWYLLAAVPAAFLASALVGAIMERGVLRFLYGRPLETLLATWGISLVLMQLVRSTFGAQNVAVENPVWMSGGLQVLPNLTLPWNRLVIIVFAFAVLAGVAYLIARTRMGLFVRGVTQNRPIASCMGVNTARVDTMAFALGSGIAGLAGCALSQVGNVGPDLGQSYIVDSFMVVVLGGVGQLAGTVYAALGLGLLNKFLEGWTGAVLAKIAVLVFIIAFIQKRPQGIFAMKGRSAE